MLKRTAVTLAVVLTTAFAGILGAGTASASTRHASHDCAVNYYPAGFGEGVMVFCDNYPGPFQVTVVCADLLNSWILGGTLGYPGDAPSVAECATPLPLGAHIADWWISPV